MKETDTARIMTLIECGMKGIECNEDFIESNWNGDKDLIKGVDKMTRLCILDVVERIFCGFYLDTIIFFVIKRHYKHAYNNNRRVCKKFHNPKLYMIR